ncbi:MAG: winged helix-turn-helix domain-containing protein [Oceanibaculum sp.]
MKAVGVTRQPPQRQGGDSETRLTIRVDFGPHGALGPGKIRLMELIGEKGSITAAGRSMKMSYRRAWLLVDALNRMFREPLIETQHGGSGGGGAVLTPLGQRVVALYRGIEAGASTTASASLGELEDALSNELVS